MRRALHLLLMIAVFGCGLHIAEPVQAHTERAHHQLEQSSADHGEHGSDDGAANASHALHHHCPLGPDQKPAAIACAMMPSCLLPTPTLIADLASLSTAPPLEPPAA